MTARLDSVSVRDVEEIDERVVERWPVWYRRLAHVGFALAMKTWEDEDKNQITSARVTATIASRVIITLHYIITYVPVFYSMYPASMHSSMDVSSPPL